MVTIKINDIEVSIPEETSILEAAKGIGIEIPHFCYHPKLSIAGSCRLCLVDVGGRLVTSCSTPVAEGMEVRTDTDAVKKAREDILALYLINHPLDCPICDKGGECPLQDYTYRYGPGESKFKDRKWHFEKPIDLSRYIVLDRERCILCTRCVRFQEEIALHPELGVYERGRGSIIATHPGREFTSNFSGNTIELCPVGALTSRPYRFKARPWDIKRTAGVCPTCGCGCNVYVDTRIGRVVRLVSRENPSIDDGWLCDRGRFNYGFLNENRIERPMIRRNGELKEVSLEEALDYTAERLKGLIKDCGKDSIAGIVSSENTSETIYSVQRFMRSAVGTNNIDHRIDGSFLDAIFLKGLRHKGVRPFTIEGLENSDLIMLIDCDPGRFQPIIDLRLKKAVKRNGARLYVINREEIGLASLAEGYMQMDGVNFIRAFNQGTGGDTGVRGLYKCIEKAEKIVVLTHARKGDEGLIILLEGIKDKGIDISFGMLTPYSNGFGASILGAMPSNPPGFKGAKVGEVFSDAIKSDEKVRALYIVLSSHPLSNLNTLLEDRVREVEFLILQDHSITPLMGYADVVLPQTAFSEADGSLVNTEGRVQSFKKASRPPAGAVEGWKIPALLAERLGVRIPSSLEGIRKEIERHLPSYMDGEFVFGGDSNVS